MGCNHDESQIIHEHLRDGQVVTTVPFKELIQQPMFTNAYKKLRKTAVSESDLFSKTAMEDDYGFTIEDAPIVSQIELALKEYGVSKGYKFARPILPRYSLGWSSRNRYLQ